MINEYFQVSVPQITDDELTLWTRGGMQYVLDNPTSSSVHVRFVILFGQTSQQWSILILESKVNEFSFDLLSVIGRNFRRRFTARQIPLAFAVAGKFGIGFRSDAGQPIQTKMGVGIVAMSSSGALRSQINFDGIAEDDREISEMLSPYLHSFWDGYFAFAVAGPTEDEKANPSLFNARNFTDYQGEP